MSKETKWTPGPWVAEVENIHNGCVATCHWNGEQWWEVWSPNLRGGGSAEANARLIAAAPELYEALMQARKELEDIAMAEIGEPYNNPQINAALAKARGEL